MVSWRGLLHESDLRADPLDGCDLLRVGYQGGHGVLYYIPGSGPSAEPGKRLLKWGYNLQVPEDALPSVLVDDQARQQSSSVPFGKVHPQVRACLESRLADLLPPLLFELVRQSSKSAIQAIYSVVPRSYARDRLCLVGDAGAVFSPFTSSGVLKAVANATSLADALVGAPAVDDALRRWSQAQLQVAAQVVPFAEFAERSQVFEMPDLAAMPTAATNDWLASAYSGLSSRSPGCDREHVGSREGGAGGARTHDWRIMRRAAAPVRLHATVSIGSWRFLLAVLPCCPAARQREPAMC